MRDYRWSFFCSDTAGKAQRFDIRAVSSAEAVDKGIARASLYAKGDICSWNCCLKTVI